MPGSRFSPKQRAKAVRIVFEARPSYPSQWAAIESVAAKIGASSETLRKWVRRAEVDGGQRPGLTSEEAAEIKKLRREVAELGRANEILKAAAAVRGAPSSNSSSRSSNTSTGQPPAPAR
ncbi:MAG TPA: transposase [Gaiellales bacterium]|nr:transposase [Gaiellales bacterium]